MSSPNYLMILGRQPELGFVELESLVGAAGLEVFGSQSALVGQPLEIDRLGSVVKIGEVLYRGPVTDLKNLPIDATDLPLGPSKTPFALSAYGFSVPSHEVMAAGLDLKKRLRPRGSVRFVRGARGLAASAAELRHNRVIEDGFELLAVRSGKEMIVARTTQVQNIDWYSKRDYERPMRSAKVGMLPPKLAQILVNSTSAPVVVDPFCGTGVILQEARLLGRDARGSDSAIDMVEATRANMEWLAAAAERQLPEWEAEVCDARDIVLPPDCAVATEGYLGPNMSQSPTPQALGAIRDDLLALYRASLRNWAKHLSSGAEVSLCVPAWRIGKHWHYLGLIDELADLGYTPKSFRAAPNPLLYARDDQIVGRQLLLLRKS